MKLKIRITETLEKIVTVEANSEKEALQIADNNYRAANDDYILDASNFFIKELNDKISCLSF